MKSQLYQEHTCCSAVLALSPGVCSEDPGKAECEQARRVVEDEEQQVQTPGAQVPWGHAEQKSRKDWTVRSRYLHSGSSSMLVKEDIQSSGHVELHSNGRWRSRVTQMSKDKIWVIGMVEAGDSRHSWQRLQVHDSKISFPSRPWMMSGAKAGAPEGSVKQDLTQEPQLQML